METIISSLITGGVLMVLIGMIYNSIVKRLERNESGKVNTEKCDVLHKGVDDKIGALFKKLDAQGDLLIIINDNVKDVKRMQTER